MHEYPSNGREPNKTPAPNRRPRFPFGTFAEFGLSFFTPPAVPAAVGEARRSAKP